jgi:hypothetical protein
MHRLVREKTAKHGLNDLGESLSQPPGILSEAVCGLCIELSQRKIKKYRKQPTATMAEQIVKVDLPKILPLVRDVMSSKEKELSEDN